MCNVRNYGKKKETQKKGRNVWGGGGGPVI